MALYIASTLVDITDNGPLNLQFPFKTKSNELVHDKASLDCAKGQQSNFNTLIQILQIRANVVWQDKPIKSTEVIANTKFGRAYTDAGKHSVWKFIFETEQTDVFASKGSEFGALEDDFDNIPVVVFCKETITFPKNAFITSDDNLTNVYFSRAVEDDLENYPHI